MGFSLTYTEGDICYDMEKYIDRTVTFNFYCDSKDKGSLAEVEESPFLCQYTYDFYTKSACIKPAKASVDPVPPPATGISSGTKFLIFLLVGVLLYLALGMTYNHFKNSTSLSDSVPNKEFWYEMPSLVQEGISFTIVTIKSGLEVAKGKMSSQAHEPI
mmetsp:Transcript_10291/g.20050  ORF Transcript_10291/g.20050 Transcript_10291/m.20050 type:complete len:159 (+) Transcript_10291:326-802(+)